MTLGLGRTALARVAVDEDYRMRPDALAATIAADRAAGHRPIAIVATVGTTSSTSVDPVAADRRHRRTRGPVAPRRLGLRGGRRPPAGSTGAVRGLGAGRFDRHQPAQVAVHAARRVAPAQPADGGAAGGVQPRPRVPADPRPADAGPRLPRVHPAARPAVPGAQAVDPSPLVRTGGAASPDRAAPGADRVVRRAGRRGAGLGAPGARPVLDGLFPLAPARLERHRRSPRRGQRRDHGRGQPHGRGLPVAHPTRRPVHDPRRDRQPAHGGAPRRACVGPAARGGGRDRGRAIVKLDPDDVQFLETTAELRDWFDANHETAAELWLGYHLKATGKPTISWSDAVDEALCVGWIDGIRKRLDDTRSAQRFTPRRKGSIWSAINVGKVAALTAAGPDATRRAACLRGPDRGEDGRLLL